MITPVMETTPPMDRSMLPIIRHMAIATESSVSVQACRSIVERLPMVKKFFTPREAITNTIRKMYVASGIRRRSETFWVLLFICSLLPSHV